MSRKKIAVLMASIDREYQTDFVRGVFDAARELDLDVCVFNCMGYMNAGVSTSDQGESAVFDLPRLADFDGVISLRATFTDGMTIRKVEQTLLDFAGKPHVSIDVPSNGAVSIQFDDGVSVRQLTEHVIREHGAKRIVYLSGPQRQIVAMTRLQACRETMKELGLELRPEDVFEGEWIHRSGRMCAEKLLARGEGLPDAILCGNDDMAFGVSEYLHEKGFNIPDDVIVTGFDALREAVTRGLTSIRRPIDEAARKAIEVLADWTKGKKPAAQDIVLPTIPVYGASCGCETEQPGAHPVMRGMRNQHRVTEDILLQISMFNGSLSSAVDEEDVYEKTDQFVRTLGIGELYLCVNPALTRDTADTENGYAYPEKMLLLYGRKGEHRLPIGLFPTRDLVPSAPENGGPMTLIFCPLYYRERNFGYVAMEMGPATGLPLYSLLMMLNGALTSLYLQSSLRSYARKVEEMSVRDIMTGLLNRRGFMERSPRQLELARQEGRCFVMLSADMDHMKQINDEYGHLMGDQAICRMGKAVERLQALGMTPVHISGDEFLAYGLTETPEAGERILAAAREAIRQENEEHPWIVEISASFGLCCAVPGEDDSIDSFMTGADREMYEEKRRKKAAGER